MNKGSKVSLVILLLGLLVLAGNSAAAKLFPRQWGGPNIGGGLLNLAAILVVALALVLSVIFLALSVVDRRKEPSRHPH